MRGLHLAAGLRRRLALAALVAIAPAWAHAQTPAPAPPAPPPAPISGYMEMHLNVPVAGRVDEHPVLDFHRFVLLFSHRFSDRIRFVGELEVEHAVVEGLKEAGELELEQAYLDFLVTPALNVRAGMMLVPVGLINERHEPPTFYGVERPFVDTVIIPSTWFDVGAGVFGTLGGKVRYRLYVMGPLDSAAFSAEDGLRGSAQHGMQAQANSASWTGRVEYVGTRGLQIGGSFWRGKSAVTYTRFDTSAGLVEADVRWSRGAFEGRAEFAQGFIGGAADLNDAAARQTGVNPNVARQIRGFYLEGAYRVQPPRTTHELGMFLRYENFDTQYRMPAGAVKLPSFDREAWVVGANYWLDPDVALKVDYTHGRSQSSIIRGPRSFNAGLGWWF